MYNEFYHLKKVQLLQYFAKPPRLQLPYLPITYQLTQI